MKNGFILFCGLFIALGISWAALALGPNAQLSALVPFYDELEAKSFPERMPGIAARGKLVYEDLGCASCHTQAVRRPGFGGDTARKWGDRQSYSRDYIHQERADLGQLRVGPDLANVGARIKSKADIYKMLYSGTENMPAYAFLFEERIAGAQTGTRAVAKIDNREVVPSARAEALAAYLVSLNSTFNYPPETTLNTLETPGANKAAAKEGEKK